jgi:hypothetical protein
MDLIRGILENSQMACKLLSHNWICGMIRTGLDLSEGGQSVPTA